MPFDTDQQATGRDTLGDCNLITDYGKYYDVPPLGFFTHLKWLVRGKRPKDDMDKELRIKGIVKGNY